jgi:hypothetical protein
MEDRNIRRTPEEWKDFLTDKKLRVLMKISEVKVQDRMSIVAYVGKIEILGPFKPHGNTGKTGPRATASHRRR